MSADCSSSSEECNVDNRLSHKRNLMNSYDTSTELACVVTPACGIACLAKGVYDTIIDSGATCHVINNDHYAQPCYNFRPARPNDGVALGDNSIKLQALGWCDIGILRDVMIVPKRTCNLISVTCLDLMGYALLMKDQRFQLIKGHIVIVSGPLIRGLYYIQTFNTSFLVSTTSFVQLLPRNQVSPLAEALESSRPRAQSLQMLI